MALKDEIVSIATDALAGIRTSIGNQRNTEFAAYLAELIKAKEAGMNPDAIGLPMLSDRVRMQVTAALSAITKTGAEGGISWTIITLKGSYSREQQTGASITADMEFQSQGVPDFSAIKTMPVADLNNLLTIVNEAE